VKNTENINDDVIQLTPYLSTSYIENSVRCTGVYWSLLVYWSVFQFGSSHNWLKSHLSNRSFSVTSGSSSIFILPSSCVVSQGSVLDSILFTIYQVYSLTVSINRNMLTKSLHSFQRLLFILLPYPCSPPYSPFS